METLAIIFQTSCVSFLLLYAGLSIRDGWKHPSIQLSVIGAVTVAALFFQSPWLPIWLSFPLRLIDAFNIAFVWLACLALLEEDFRFEPIHWIGLLGYGASTLPYRFAYVGLLPPLPEWFRVSADIITFALVVHLIWKAVEGYREDLIDKRRNLRIFFIFGCALAISIAIFGENVLEGMGIGQHARTLTAIVTLPIAIALNVWVLRMQPEVLAFQPIRPAAPSAPTIRPQDEALHAKLVHLMDSERIWAESGLTIGALARQVSVPEHQLRALINRGMGYRNFASFLSSYRLAYAKSVLADLDQARLPVLTIAMDAGFGSLAPFNRAFKQAEGVTPTAYRADALAKTASDQS